MQQVFATLEAALAERQPDAYRRIVASPAARQYANQVLIHSRFLTDAILRHPEWIEELADSEAMFRTYSPADFDLLLHAELQSEPVTPLLLARFRRRQILRIMLRDVLGFGTLGEITEELSHLADTIIEAAWMAIHEKLAATHGAPASGFSVIALGKLGGLELNYSSDIDLLFVYEKNGETESERPLTYKEFFKKAATELTEMLSTYTPEGLCYRVDLRLRPEGRLGEVCVSLDGAKHYYEKRARDWELQMMIKSRVAAGDKATGAALLDFVEPLTYSTTLDFTAVEVMSDTRERLNEKLSAKRIGKGGIDVKLAPGGIRDIEFLVQCLQRLHGGRFTWLRRGGSLLALSRLQHKGLISDAEYARLVNAYQFLRTVEHRLQLLDDRQTHALPTDSEELENLAARMPVVPGADQNAVELMRQVNNHFDRVREIYERVVHAQTAPAPAQPKSEILRHEPNNLMLFLDQRAPTLAAELRQSRLRRGHLTFEQFLEKLLTIPERIDALNHNVTLARSVIEIFERSPYFAEQLIRIPDLIEDLSDAEAAELPEPPPADPAGLRRYFLRHMVRIQAASICGTSQIFETLERTSELAEAVVAKAYAMAIAQVAAEHPPKNPAYIPKDQMMVIALGRLGMREFDLASDADLNFVIPESDAGEIIYWTRVAERMIDILSAYTGEGAMFAVDTRLRPAGRVGALAQTDIAYLRYFENHSDAWEGIAYMKARAVAGDIELGTDFLGRLQETDWLRWGQSGRSRGMLGEMRTRIEKEQGAGNPLKAGPGGYYDIDFILMFLRLKGGGIFFRVLNTPERLSVLEEMLLLDREDVSFLSDAATFYRAIDHGLRLYSGHAEGQLPKSEAKLEALTELVRRWTPERLHDRPLEDQLELIQQRTRRLFRRFFPA
ncbi:MAG TPA: glutamine-synthetase adenylyltransferase [Bryobacteraceae bacterium]|jgi:glutamate-ammonia-ligase adenylyltransferase